MRPDITPVTLAEGNVDEGLEHMELTYGSVQEEDDFRPVALVAPIVPGLHDRFAVQYLPVPTWNTDRVEGAWEAVRRELDFYLVELEKPDPWNYAIYHCGTASNLYSHVHWGHYLTERVSPMPDQRFALPGSADPSGLFQTEAAGTFWMWVWPELLNWGREIVWLFAPVTGKRVWPGDLWGVDQHGELVLVETKRVKKEERSQDPYEDFIDFEFRQAVPDVDAILEHWWPLCQHEKRFIRERQADLEKGNRVVERRTGIVDVSRKRLMIWRWRELYLRRVAPWILSGNYELTVRRNLEERVRLGNPPPHYFALFTLFDDSYPKLSTEGLKNRDRLLKLAGRDRVHARAVAARPISGGRVQIRSLPANIFEATW